MIIQEKSVAGTLESCDCLVMAQPHASLEIHLDSIVEKRYGEHIRGVITQTLEELGVSSGLFMVTDRGALDYCIKSRVATVVRRGVKEC